jgi:hypothetical protein
MIPVVKANLLEGKRGLVVSIATAFLAHDAARLITGEPLYIDGGYHIIDWPPHPPASELVSLE